jgi:hypothetical protein
MIGSRIKVVNSLLLPRHPRESFEVYRGSHVAFHAPLDDEDCNSEPCTKIAIVNPVIVFSSFRGGQGPTWNPLNRESFSFCNEPLLNDTIKK